MITVNESDQVLEKQLNVDLRSLRSKMCQNANVRFVSTRDDTEKIAQTTGVLIIVDVLFIF